ncbi:MAG: hypothetical protein LBQ38_04625 [Spirochaetaceae bacterium]|jgi:hypothetical protein|nr:hypothetical protein [Spirochaetaceae bacterium]
MRARLPLFGELVQTDASPFDWFGTGIQYALHGFQDNATGDILGLYLCEHECLAGYFEAFRAVLTGYGVPETLYADRIGIYFVNTKKPEHWSIEEQLAGKTLDKTQFARIAEKPGCGLIPAGSPQVKGRIERLWETLQSRLTEFFQFHQIKDIKCANAALPDFVAEFNKSSTVNLPPKTKRHSPRFPPVLILIPCSPPNTIARRTTQAASHSKIIPSRSIVPNRLSKKMSYFCSVKNWDLKRITTKPITMSNFLIP